MNHKEREKYSNYIAAAIRFSIKETGIEWPDSVILVVKGWHALATVDEIVGIPVFITGMPSPFDFMAAFPAQFEDKKRLLASFLEYLVTYDID